jgi:hypothetical protein
MTFVVCVQRVLKVGIISGNFSLFFSRGYFYNNLEKSTPVSQWGVLVIYETDWRCDRDFVLVRTWYVVHEVWYNGVSCTVGT